MNRRNQSTWNWCPIKSHIRSQNGRSLLSLTPTVTIEQQLQMNFRIDTERELQYSSELGWNWHKSWNIPNISIKMSIKKDDICEDAQWPFCQVQIFAVKSLQDDTYEEVGLEGNTTQELVDGKAFFSGIKFNSTTYNHQGKRFHLLIIMKHREDILLSLISPQVFVDSRKSARDEHRQIQYIQPFDPRVLEKNFCKKEKHFNDVVDAPIENNENGLHNYLTAPNIRNKIKHPLFLAIKFSKCLGIYLKSEVQIQTGQEIILKFQSELMKKEESDFAIGYQSNNNRIKKKIEESLTQLFVQCQMKVIEKKNINEAEYKRIQLSEEDYSKSYEQLLEMMEEPIPIKKFCRKDFDKLPTKSFDDILEEKQHIKEEENEQQQQQQQSQPSQLSQIDIQQLQQQQQQQFQMMQYFLFQHQLMMQMLMH